MFQPAGHIVVRGGPGLRAVMAARNSGRGPSRRRTRLRGLPRDVLLRWSTDARLRIVTLHPPEGLTGVPKPRVGRIIQGPIRIRSILDRAAHAAALRGETSTYRRRIRGREYEVEVLPRFGPGRAIVGTASFVREASTTPADPGMRARSSVRLSMELARSVAQTAQYAADIRTRKVRELQQLTEQALLRTEADERRARFIADASSVLDSTPDPGAALDRLGELLLQRFADWWVLEIRDGDTLQRVAVRGRDPAIQEFLRTAVPPRLALGISDLLRLPSVVIHSGAELPSAENFVPGVDPRELPRVRLGSFVRVPVMLHGRLVGVLAVGVTDPAASFGESDARVAADLARRIALAQESSRLYLEAQREIALRKEAEARLLRFNAELERRVSERTTLLEEANREANSFAYTVAHDLRAPLRAITGFSQVLLEEEGGALDPSGRDYLNRIIAGARRMDELIRDLLEYSRLNRADITLGVVDLDDLLPRTMAMLAQEQKERSAEVSWTTPLGKVIAQDVILAQALRNLISNAMKFVARGKRPDVRVSSERRDGLLRIFVRDNGIGVAPEHRQRIFGMFERLNSAEDYPGTGMGLAIVRRAAERLGGEVGVDSAEGGGSTFWIDLPAPSAIPLPGPESPPSVPPGPGSS